MAWGARERGSAVFLPAVLPRPTVPAVGLEAAVFHQASETTLMFLGNRLCFLLMSFSFGILQITFKNLDQEAECGIEISEPRNPCGLIANEISDLACRSA